MHLAYKTAVSPKPKTVLSWSSGKDSAYSLHVLRERGELEVVGLLTTINAEAERVAMHAVRVELLRRQAEAAGLPLSIVELPHPCTNEEYARRMGAWVEQARSEGVERVAFGDLFLEDIRAYREAQLAGTGLEPVFPLWGRETGALAREMLDAGIVAQLTCIDPRVLAKEFVGRQWDAELIAELPEDVDPCGENGEFHSFVSAAPCFSHPVEVALGEVVERGGFVFRDLLPGGSNDPNAASSRGSTSSSY